MDIIISFDPRARQTNVHPLQRAVCPLLDNLAYILTGSMEPNLTSNVISRAGLAVGAWGSPEVGERPKRGPVRFGSTPFPTNPQN